MDLIFVFMLFLLAHRAPGKRARARFSSRRHRRYLLASAATSTGSSRSAASGVPATPAACPAFSLQLHAIELSDDGGSMGLSGGFSDLARGPVDHGGQYADRFRDPNFARQFPQGFDLERALDR